MSVHRIVSNIYFGVLITFDKVFDFFNFSFIKTVFNVMDKLLVNMKKSDSQSETKMDVLNNEFYTNIFVHWSKRPVQEDPGRFWVWKDLISNMANKIRNSFTILGRYFNIEEEQNETEKEVKQYEFGIDWYKALLGPTMQHTSGYWETAQSLDEAQIANLDLIAQKLKLKPGMNICDLGSGWGALALHLAKTYQVSVLCITNGKEQANYIRSMAEDLPIEVLESDYRDIPYDVGTFDRVTCLGLTANVALHEHNSFFRTIRRLLKNGGLVLLETVIRNEVPLESMQIKKELPNPWANTRADIAKGVEGLLIIEDWVTHDQYYLKTLEAWLKNFYKMWPEFEDDYDDEVFQKWEYYLAGTIALFKSRKHSMSQIVLSKAGAQTEFYANVR